MLLLFKWFKFLFSGTSWVEVVLLWKEDREIWQAYSRDWKLSGCHKIKSSDRMFLGHWWSGIISAFTERWHKETSSFHLSVGEVTITMHDVASLLHLPITGAFHSIEALHVDKVVFLLVELLEVSSKEVRDETVQYHGAYVQLLWLRDIYRSKCDTTQWTVVAWAYLLHLVGCTLFANKSATYMHMVFLDAFHDLIQTGSYAWGAIALVHMYDNLNDASKSSARQLARYITLLFILNFIFNYVIYIEYSFEFFCFWNMCSVGSTRIFLLLLLLLLLKIIKRGNHVLAAGSLGRHYQCQRIISVWIDLFLMLCARFLMVTIIHSRNLRWSLYFSDISYGVHLLSYIDQRGLCDSLGICRQFLHTLLLHLYV